MYHTLKLSRKTWVFAKNFCVTFLKVTTLSAHSRHTHRENIILSIAKMM